MDARKKADARAGNLEKGEGFVEGVKFYFYKAIYYAQDNALLVCGTFFVGLIPLVL